MRTARSTVSSHDRSNTPVANVDIFRRPNFMIVRQGLHFHCLPGLNMHRDRGEKALAIRTHLPQKADQSNTSAGHADSSPSRYGIAAKQERHCHHYHPRYREETVPTVVLEGDGNTSVGGVGLCRRLHHTTVIPHFIVVLALDSLAHGTLLLVSTVHRPCNRTAH